LKNIDHIKRLVQKAQDKSISKNELDELLQWLENDEATEYMPDIWGLLGVEAKESGVEEKEVHSPDSEVDYSSQWHKLSDKIPEEDVHADHSEILPFRKDNRINPVGRWAVAAAVLVLCSVLGVVLLKINKHPESIAKSPDAAKNKDAIMPGTKKAILITGNGNEIMLDSSSDKMIVQGKNFSIQTNKKGQLVNNSTGTSEEVRINTVATPPGGQYEVILPDGTAATLNAASSISYPTAFQSDKRDVKITGEVYFEVARDPRKPFVVRMGRNMQIEVLGTQFDVNAYSNEPSVKATLLEGAVRVIAEKAEQILRPLEQAQLTDDGNLHLLKNVDVGSVVAWKNGIFEFNGTDIRTVMREISRWYNVDIVYDGDPPTDLFSAMIDRQNNIDQVLTMLQNTLRVHFSIKNRSVYVSN
jgi:transmembrane sensor